jgi:hypothetical protein
MPRARLRLFPSSPQVHRAYYSTSVQVDKQYLSRKTSSHLTRVFRERSSAWYNELLTLSTRNMSSQGRVGPVASVENRLQALWRCTDISSHCLLTPHTDIHVRTVQCLFCLAYLPTLFHLPYQIQEPRDSLTRHGTYTTIRSRTGTKLSIRETPIPDPGLSEPTNLSLQWMDEYELTAKYNLAETCCASISIDELLALSEDKTATASQLLDSSKIQGYGEIRGSTELRNNLSRLYSSKVGTPLPAENILITPGAIAANHLALYALVGPGDHVICHYPTYQQLYSIPESLGAEVSLWKSKAENKWLPDLEELKALVKPNTKLIIIKYVSKLPHSIPKT